MPPFPKLALKPFHCAPLLGSSLLFSLALHAQPAESLDILRRPDGTPELVRFEPAEAPPSVQAAQVLHHTLHLGRQSEMRPLGAAETDANGLTIQRFQQYYQGLPVEFTRYHALSRNGRLELISGEVRELPDGALSVQPRLTAAAALPAALAFVHAQKYMWQTPHEGDFARQTEGKSTFRPTGELVIVDNELARDRPGKPVLAWKFDIYAAQPVSRDWVYVDAQTGKVVNQDAIIKHANTTAVIATKYSGSLSLKNYGQYVAFPFYYTYYLHDYSRGEGIETYNLHQGYTLSAATPFTDDDNLWTAAEYNNVKQDWGAGDAFFGAQQNYDYWWNAHNRSSFDNVGGRIKSYVHYDPTPGDGTGFANAYWNGSVLLYGDGALNNKPQTSVDMCAHEFGHAVCQYTAGLQSKNESGALSEGFADIWAACVEQRVATTFGLAGKNTWLIGEEVMMNGGALRSLSNPNQYGQPDTYQGTNWLPPVSTPNTLNDYGWIHNNSGVLTYWFYLLSQGGVGTNDKGNYYTVNSIGITDAAKIAYLTERFLSPTANFKTAREKSLKATMMLFGANSTQYRAVANAWYAVGVGYGVAYGTATNAYIGFVQCNQMHAKSFGITGQNYTDYTNDSDIMAGLLPRCWPETITLARFFANGAPVIDTYWNVYIDFNKDQDFNDIGEHVVDNLLHSRYNNFNTITEPLITPATLQTGYTRMRVTMSQNANMTHIGSIGAGEVEDYPVMIGYNNIAMPSIQSVNVSNAATFTAVVEWDLGNPVSPYYEIHYRPIGSNNWMTTFADLNVSWSNSRVISGLMPSTSYELKVRGKSDCAIGTFSSSVFFTTPANRSGGAPSGGATIVEAYPSPATDVLHLTLTADRDGSVPPITDVAVYDLRGAKVEHAHYEGNGTLRLDGLTPGLYTATVLGGATPASIRFVKQ